MHHRTKQKLRSVVVKAINAARCHRPVACRPRSIDAARALAAARAVTGDARCCRGDTVTAGQWRACSSGQDTDTARRGQKRSPFSQRTEQQLVSALIDCRGGGTDH